MAFVPRSACRIVDTWEASGLRGTGSHDVLVEDATVPASRTLSFAGRRLLSTPLYGMPFAATLAAGCAALCLGVARSALEVLRSVATSKVPADGGPPLRDSPRVLSVIARNTTEHTAARLVLHASVEQAWRACQAGVPLTHEQRAAMWGAAHHAARASRRVVRQAHEHSGATALYTACPLERAHRDIHAMAQHIILSTTWLEDAGRVWTGAEPVAPMFRS